jgi:hypothetical protein
MKIIPRQQGNFSIPTTKLHIWQHLEDLVSIDEIPVLD